MSASVLPAADFAHLAAFLREASGLSLDAGKADFAGSRLSPLLRKHGLCDLVALIARLRKGDAALSVAVVEAMATHESSFFRDGPIFRQLREKVIPALCEARGHKRRLSIWCAGMGNGQEAYSLAMKIDAMKELAGWDVDILATDLSHKAVARAQRGHYSTAEIEHGLPIQRLGQYFQRQGEAWVIAKALREKIRFREFNLLDSFDELGAFDLILCRNVLIYFDSDTKLDVLRRFGGALATDGYLLLGAAETMHESCRAFRPVAHVHGLYQKAGVMPRSIAEARAGVPLAG
jgi:chemotaxis protein methyltransferase CheR